MAHDTIAVSGDVVVAHLRRTAWDGLNSAIYRALQSEQDWSENSGVGTERQFSADELAAALQRLPEGDALLPEREFLRKCAGRGGVRIAFC